MVRTVGFKPVVQCLVCVRNPALALGAELDAESGSAHTQPVARKRLYHGIIRYVPFNCFKRHIEYYRLAFIALDALFVLFKPGMHLLGSLCYFAGHDGLRYQVTSARSISGNDSESKQYRGVVFFMA